MLFSLELDLPASLAQLVLLTTTTVATSMPTTTATSTGRKGTDLLMSSSLVYVLMYLTWGQQRQAHVHEHGVEDRQAGRQAGGHVHVPSPS